MLTSTDIEKLREDLNESQEAFGKRFNVTQTAVWRWENGKPPQRGMVVQALAKLRGKTAVRPTQDAAA